MRAKLPISDEPGFRLKQVHREMQHGEVDLYALDDEASDPERTLFYLADGVLIGVAPASKADRIRAMLPTTREGVLEALRENQLASRGYGALHLLVWEALDLPMEIRQARIDEGQEKRRVREEEFAARRRQEDAAAEADWQRIAQAIASDDRVSGEDLLVAAERLGVPVNPRTSGMIRSKVQWITSQGAAVPAGTSAQSAFRVYFEVRKALTQA